MGMLYKKGMAEQSYLLLNISPAQNHLPLYNLLQVLDYKTKFVFYVNFLVIFKFFDPIQYVYDVFPVVLILPVSHNIPCVWS